MMGEIGSDHLIIQLKKKLSSLQVISKIKLTQLLKLFHHMIVSLKFVYRIFILEYRMTIISTCLKFRDFYSIT